MGKLLFGQRPACSFRQQLDINTVAALCSCWRPRLSHPGTEDPNQPLQRKVLHSVIFISDIFNIHWFIDNTGSIWFICSDPLCSVWIHCGEDVSACRRCLWGVWSNKNTHMPNQRQSLPHYGEVRLGKLGRLGRPGSGGRRSLSRNNL